MRRKIVWCVLALALVPAPAFAQVRRNQAPNVSGELQSYVNRYADAWTHAHDGGPRTAEWITLAVQTLRAEHPGGKRWCLNGKRGSSRDTSWDVVAYLVDEANGNNKMVEAYDVIGDAGGANPRIVWNNVTNYETIGREGTALCIAPPDLVPTAGGGSGSGGGGNPPPAPPSPAPAVDLKPITDALAALSAKLDTLTVKVDAVAGVAVAARDAAMSAEHDSREINAARLTAPVPVLAVPCLVGRVPRAFGGSVEVQFCPVAQ